MDEEDIALLERQLVRVRHLRVRQDCDHPFPIVNLQLKDFVVLVKDFDFRIFDKLTKNKLYVSVSLRIRTEIKGQSLGTVFSDSNLTTNPGLEINRLRFKRVVG